MIRHHRDQHRDRHHGRRDEADVQNAGPVPEARPPRSWPEPGTGPSEPRPRPPSRGVPEGGEDFDSLQGQSPGYEPGQREREGSQEEGRALPRGRHDGVGRGRRPVVPDRRHRPAPQKAGMDRGAQDQMRAAKRRHVPRQPRWPASQVVSGQEIVDEKPDKSSSVLTARRASPPARSAMAVTAPWVRASGVAAPITTQATRYDQTPGRRTARRERRRS